MSIKNWGIWRAGIFKNMKFMFSTIQRTQETLLVSEASTLSVEHWPMTTGFFSYVDRHMSWLVEHKLKNRVKETGRTLLEVTERSYVPTDSFQVFSAEDAKTIQQLDEVAHARYIEKRNSLNSGAEEASNIKRNILYLCVLIVVIIVISSWGN
jgi:hypothetical protein